MKNAMLALMFCMGVTACVADASETTDEQSLTTDEAAPSQSKAEMQITGHELIPTPGGGKATNSCFIGSAPCIGQYEHTCNFECCDGAIGAVPAVCSNCLGHANDYCQTQGHGGTYYAWWTN